MDLRDSPAEAEFRARFRAWLAENNPGLPVSSTDDEYWARQAEWHTALYDAGFFGLSWPSRFGGHDLPPVFDVILDEELAAAGAPPRPSLGYLVQGIATHGSDAAGSVGGLVADSRVATLLGCVLPLERACKASHLGTGVVRRRQGDAGAAASTRRAFRRPARR